MKTSNYLYLSILAALLIGAGCRSDSNRASNNIRGPSVAPQPSYTIESIPAGRLSPTSREGDKPGVVYSSNIIAVYVNKPNGMNTSVTNGVITDGERAR